MAKQLLYGIEARNALLRGIDKPDTVKSPRPKGRNVVLDKNMVPRWSSTTVLPLPRN